MAHQCGHCPKSFKTQSGREWHMENIHGAPKRKYISTSPPAGRSWVVDDPFSEKFSTSNVYDVIEWLENFQDPRDLRKVKVWDLMHGKPFGDKPSNGVEWLQVNKPPRGAHR